jgi:hypothetical protein
MQNHKIINTYKINERTHKIKSLHKDGRETAVQLGVYLPYIGKLRSRVPLSVL